MLDSLALEEQDTRWEQIIDKTIAILTCARAADRRIPARSRANFDNLLEGSVGGSILEGTEELSLRVRVADAQRGNPSQVESLDLISPKTENLIPLDTLAEVKILPRDREIDAPQKWWC